MNKKRIAAIIGLLLMVGMYIATFIFALIDSPFARSCLMASLFCTIAVPVTVYAYLMLLNMLNRNKDADLNTDSPAEDSDDQA